MIKIITISHEFGSGGGTIGKEVAKKLGIPCYDKDFIEKAADYHLSIDSGFLGIETAVALIIDAVGGAIENA